jgi:sulfoxide reductase heme-binding subunit YedZ
VRHRSVAPRIDRTPAAPSARPGARAPRPHPKGSRGPISGITPIVFALCLLPFALIAWHVLYDVRSLGANPIKEVEHRTGLWTIRFVAFTLAITPLRRLSGWNVLVRYRRMIGLFAFFYATVHLSVYAGVDLELDLGEVGSEIVKRPYLVVGFTSWLLLVPLAITSTRGWIRRLGGRRWNRLHQLVYLTAVGGTIHFIWSQKKDVREALCYAALFASLLGYRVWMRFAQRSRRP